MKFLSIIFLSLFILIPSIAIATEGPFMVQKAKSIDEPVKMYDSSSCKTCHEKI